MVSRWVFLLFAVISLPRAQACSEYLLETGLSVQHLELMRSHSKGLITFTQLMENLPSKGTLLGITGANERYDVLAKTTGLTPWNAAYQKFGVDPGERHHTDKFMDVLTKQDELIVFLVPSGLWSHPDGIATKREMWWLLSHPERMKHVLFVLGAYP